MLVVNLQAQPDSQVVGIVAQKGTNSDCLYEMCEMLYQIMTQEDMLHIFDDAITLVQARLQEEGR